MELLVYQNPEAKARGINPFDHGPLHTDMWKTEGLKQALDKYGFDAAFGGARRDEEKSRAKERIFSFRSANHRWDPKNQRPELWNLYNARKAQGESIRVFPISNWTELDIWQYIHLRATSRSCRSTSRRARPAVERDGLLHHGRRRALAAASPARSRPMRSIRFRTLGCYPLTGAVESEAATLPADHPGDAADDDLRAPGPRHRPRPGREHGEEEAGGLFLMRATTDAIYVTGPRSPRTSTPISLQHQHKTLLRFITCGCVDDGKSTLIGRLLYDSKMIFEDQLAALEADSKRVGTQGQDIDFALLVDGLAAEREQGITIDVAYRFFATDKRKFIVADTPGHEQYTRNMVTGASTADLAVILIDARKGVLTQTRRHSYLAHLIGIRHVVLAVNKMDLVGYDQARVRRASSPTTASSPTSIGIDDFAGDPDLGPRGRQHHRALGQHALVRGPDADRAPRDRRGRRRPPTQARPFRMPVQWVNRPNLDFRGFCRPDRRRARAAGRRRARAALGQDHHDQRASSPWTATSTEAVAGQSVTLTLRRRDRLLARRRHRRGRRAAARSPTSSRPPSSGWRTRRCCRAAPTG